MARRHNNGEGSEEDRKRMSERVRVEEVNDERRGKKKAEKGRRDRRDYERLKQGWNLRKGDKVGVFEEGLGSDKDG